MDHDLGDREILEVEKPAEHVALDLGDAAFLVQKVELVAQLLVGRQDRRLPRLSPKGSSISLHDPLDADRRRAA